MEPSLTISVENLNRQTEQKIKSFISKSIQFYRLEQRIKSMESRLHNRRENTLQLEGKLEKSIIKLTVLQEEIETLMENTF